VKSRVNFSNKRGIVVIGQRFKQYEILSELGRGAMGCVYLARDDQGKQSALKVILPEALELAEDADVIRKRFLREARLSAQCKSPNVVDVFDFGLHDKTLYMSCEVVTGGSLEDLLKKQQRIHERELLEISRGIVKGLVSMDEERLIHRDIKPANILLTAEGQVKIADLGLARSTRNDHSLLTKKGQILGTPLYMAPEIISALPIVDIRCDLYSLGTMMFHCLTGKPPFLAKKLAALFKKHLREPIPDPRTLLTGASQETSELVMALMAKEARNRPGNPVQVLESIEKIILAVAPAKGSPVSLAATVIEKQTASALTGQETGANLNYDPNESLSGLKTHVGQMKQITELELGGSPAQAQSSAVLKFEGPQGSFTLFVLAATSATFGRNTGVEGQFCLRLRPGAQFEDHNMKISGKHLSIEARANGAVVKDLGSTHGSQFQGQGLRANAALKIVQPSLLNIAEVIDLEIRPFMSKQKLTIKTLPPPNSELPAIQVGRIKNSDNHSYAILPGLAFLKLDALKGPLIDAQGPILLMNVRNRLFIASRLASGFSPARPLVQGLNASFPPFQLSTVQFQDNLMK
jgi:serine/threonine protein kinase